MTKAEKVKFVINTLQNIYPEIPVPLNHKDPYTLLIAVLLSAQSTDVRVNEITPLLCEWHFVKAPYSLCHPGKLRKIFSLFIQPELLVFRSRIRSDKQIVE